MEFLKNISGEIARSLDSDQVKQDQSSVKDSDETSINAVTNNETPLVTNTMETSSQPETNWGKWEDVKTTPINTPTATVKTSRSHTDFKVNTTTPSMTTPPGPSVTPTKSKLDSLSREELLERVKKQTVLLQKMKTRSEELTRECNKLKKDTATSENNPTNVSPNNEALMQEMQVLKNERDQLLTEIKSVKQMIAAITIESESKVNGLEEEKKALEALLKNKEDDNLNKLGSLQCELNSIREELVTCSSERDGLIKEREESRGCDLQDSVKLLQEENEKLCMTIDNLSQQLTESRVGFEQDKSLLLDDRNKLEQDLKERLGETRNQLKSVKNELDVKANEIEHLKTNYEAMKESCRISREDQLEAERKLDEVKNELLTVKSTETTLSQKLAELESSEQTIKVLEEVSEESSEVEGTSIEELEELKTSLSKIQEERDLLAQELKNVRLTYDDEKKKLLEEHEECISALKEDLNSLKGRESSLLEENSKIKVEIKEMQRTKEEEMKKLKAIAVKLKKELGEAREKEVNLKEESRRHMNEEADMKLKFDKLKKEMDRVTEQLESCQGQLGTDQTKQCEDKNKIQSLEDQLKFEISKNNTLVRENAQAITKLEEESKLLKEEKESIHNNLTRVTEDLHTTKQELEQHAAEITSLNKALSDERESHSGTQKKLSTAEKEMKSSSLIDLELADYQRSVEGLKNELDEKKAAISILEEKVLSMTTLKEQVQLEKDNVQSEITVKDEMTNKLKAMLRKTTKELSDAKAQINDSEITVSKCEGELEKMRLENEQAKMEIATLTAKMQTNINEHQTSKNHQSQLIHSLESKVTRLHSQSLQHQEEMRKAKEEHENYKIRVHSVLKQKSTTPSVDEIESGLRQKHELDLLKMKVELKEVKDQLAKTLVDHEELEMEHHQLSVRHEQLLLDSQLERQQLNTKLFDFESKYRLKSREYEDVIGGLKRDIIENTQAFKRQLLESQEAYNNESTRLQYELKTTTARLDKLQQEADNLVLAKKTTTTTTTNTHKSQINRESNTPVNEVVVVLPSEERSAGEGMDIDELKNSEKKDDSQQPSVSLERLLSTSSSELPLHTYTPVSNEVGAVDVTALQVQVQVTEERIGHLRELLYESEDNCVRLTDQAKLLKEEIRRLERNNERLREASNMEYMKNVVLKFLHNESSNERAGLIPVIAKLLQLSQQEVKYLEETIEGNNVALPDPSGVNPSGGGGASKLGSYLHRWTGY